MSGFLETAIQNSQGDESIKTETLRILEEAKEIQESVGDENAQREYEEVRLSTIGALTNLRHETRDDLDSIRAELGEGGSIDVYKYAEGDITQSELGNITKEFEDLKRTESGEASESGESENKESELNQGLLDVIKTTNSEIIAGGEEELGKNINFYLNAYWIGTSGEDYEVISMNLENIRDSNENIYTKLLKLSQVILSANQKLNTAGRLAVAAVYGSNFEETHNYATQDIVKRVIDNSDNVFAIGYNPEDGGYYVNEGEIDKSNDMEVATYLYSLSKAQKLTSENLLMPNGPFNSSELFVLIENYKEGGNKVGFGGAEVQGLFTPYLTKFEEDMGSLICDYFIAEVNSENLVSTLNAGLNANRSDLLPTPDELAPRLRDTDTTTIPNGPIREGIKQIRTDEVTQEIKEFKHTFLQNISLIFQNSSEILEFIGDSFEYSNNSQLNFTDFSTQLEVLIEKHNTTTGNEPIIFAPIHLEGIYQHINNIRSADLEVSFTATLSSISEMNAYTAEMQDKLRTQQEEITRLQRSRGANNQDIEDAQSELKGAEIRESEARQYQEWLEYQRQTQESAGADGDISEDLIKIEESEKELQGLLMSFTGSSININISNPVHRNYILEKPKERLILVSSATELASIIHEADDILRAKGGRNKVRINDINPDFLTEPTILTFFTQQERLRNVFVGKLPENVFQNQELAKVIFDGSEFLWEKLFQNIYTSNSRNDAIAIIKFLVESKDSNFNEQEKNYLEKAIPTEIYEDVLGKPSELEYTGMVDDFEKFKGNINLLINPPERIVRPLGRTDSFLSPSAVALEGEMNEFDIGFDEISLAENLIQYIRINGLDSDSLNEISSLFEAGVHNKLTNYVIGILNPNNTEQLEFAKTLITKDNSDGENTDGRRRDNSYKYRYFNAAMKSEGSILQKMGEYGIDRYSSDIVQRITSQKLFAQYLIGFNSNPENNIRDLRIHNHTNLLKTKIVGNSENDELTPEEEAALNLFFQRSGELRNIINSIEREIDGISENHKQGIIHILESAGLDTTIIDYLLKNKNLEDLSIMDDFLFEVGEKLDAALPASLEGFERDKRIKEIILQIMEVNEEAQDARTTTADENVEIDKNSQSILDKLGYINENSQIDFDGLSKNYLEEYRLENLSEITIDNINEIQKYLESLGLNEEDISLIAPSIQLRMKSEIQRRAHERYAAGESWKDGLDNPPGLYRGTEEIILKNIRFGNYTYGEPIQNDSTKIKCSQSQQNLNTSEMGLDTLDTYREISTELMLTPEEQNSLTNEELIAIASSESVRESFIGFRSTLVELGLTELWKFRGDIFKAIGSLDFSVADGDYIGENEFNIFLSETVYATTGEKRLKPTPSNLESTKQIIREVNHQTGGPNDVDSVNTVGEAMTLVENNFREKFAPKDAGIISFNIGAFQKARRV